jgi:hypothetical protein
MAQLVIDPEVDDYEHALELLDVLYGRGETIEDDDAEDLGAETEDPSVPVDGFTPKRMRRYVANLTPDGQKILRYIAKHAPQVEMDDVQADCGYEAAVYAGRMSTFGHAIRNTKGVSRMPFTKHYRVYSINQQVAQMAIDALDRIGA